MLPAWSPMQHRDGNVIDANKAFKTLTGYDPHEVIDKTP